MTSWLEVNVDGNVYNAVNYNNLSGDVKVGDTVVLNTTAVDLSLGTGGYHFVIYNCNTDSIDTKGTGHIMKLRYTPFQLKCSTAEEENSPYHDKFTSKANLNGSIYIVGTLHSMLAPIACMLKWLDSDLKINYIMTDAGALPIQFSKTVQTLKNKGIIDNTITVGHSFGGDLECVNIYTGLIAASNVLKGDINIITMGPGIVGTSTKYGFTGIEQGYIIDAINKFNGVSFAVPRISFQDKRERHRGISHHTITVLSEICYSKTNIIIPIMDNYKMDIINKQLINDNILEKHNIFYEHGDDIEKALDYFDVNVTTMGRNIHEDREYFLTLGAVGNYAVNYLKKKED